MSYYPQSKRTLFKKNKGISLVLCLSLVSLFLFSAVSISTSFNKAAIDFSRQKEDPKFWDADKFIDISEIHPGDIGYGITVFSGTKRERFEVEIVQVATEGTMADASKMAPKILAKIKHPLLKETGPVGGMSGSPVYVKGKLLGAVSHTVLFNRNALGFIQPIREMLYLLEQENIPFSLDSSKDTMTKTAFTPTRLNAEVQISKFMDTQQTQQQDILSKKYNISRASTIQTTSNKSSSKMFSNTPSKTIDVQPGDCTGIAFVLGDLNITGMGTLSYRKDNQVLMFGHYADSSLLIKNAHFNAPLVQCSVPGVISAYSRSDKLSNFMRIIGRVTHQSKFGVKGELGKKPTMIPLNVNYRIKDKNYSFQFQLAQQVLHDSRKLFFLERAILESWTQVNLFYSVPKDIRVQIKQSVEVQNKLTNQTNIIESTDYTNSQLTPYWLFKAINPTFNIIHNLKNNPFTETQIKRLDLEINLTSSLQTLLVESIIPLKTKIKRGDVVPILVHLVDQKNNHQQDITIPVKIPKRISSNQIKLTIGEKTSSLVNPVYSYQQLIKFLQTQGKQKSLLTVQIEDPKNFIIEIEGMKNPNLPSSMLPLLIKQHKPLFISPSLIEEEIDIEYLIKQNQSIYLDLID